MADGSTTAQVHPEKLTNELLNHAKDKGTKVQIGTVEGLEFDAKGTVQGPPPSSPSGKESALCIVFRALLSNPSQYQVSLSHAEGNASISSCQSDCIDVSPKNKP